MRLQPLGLIILAAAGAADITRSRLYFRDADSDPGAPLSYDDASLDIPAEAMTTLEDGRRQIDLSHSSIDFGAGVPSDGNVWFAITDIDDAGNESDLSETITVPFDIEAPPAPTGLVYVPASGSGS